MAIMVITCSGDGEDSEPTPIENKFTSVPTQLYPTNNHLF